MNHIVMSLVPKNIYIVFAHFEYQLLALKLEQLLYFLDQ